LINGIVPCNAPPPDYFSMMKELHGIGNRLNLPTPNLRLDYLYLECVPWRGDIKTAERSAKAVVKTAQHTTKARTEIGTGNSESGKTGGAGFQSGMEGCIGGVCR